MGIPRILWLLLVSWSVTLLAKCSFAQFFDPNMDDQVFLDNIARDVHEEVVDTKNELMTQAKIVEGVTKAYIGATVKQNLFKALRLMAENELDTMSIINRPRQPRQENEEADDDDEPSSTRRGLIPQLALILKAVFGQGTNFTKHAESATSFLPKPIGNQIVGVVTLLDGSRNKPTVAPGTVVDAGNGTAQQQIVAPGTATVSPGGAAVPTVQSVNSGASAPVAAPSAPIVAGVPAPVVLPVGAPAAATPAPIVVYIPATTPARAPTQAATTAAPEEDDDDDETNRGRQVQIPGFDLIENWLGRSPKNTSTPTPVTTTESASGFEEETSTLNSLTITALVDGVRNQLDELTQNVPDIFQGAREAYKLLESVSGLFERLNTIN